MINILCLFLDNRKRKAKNNRNKRNITTATTTSESSQQQPTNIEHERVVNAIGNVNKMHISDIVNIGHVNFLEHVESIAATPTAATKNSKSTITQIHNGPMTNGGPHYGGDVHLQTCEGEYHFEDNPSSALKASQSALVQKSNKNVSNGVDECSCESCCTYAAPVLTFPAPLDKSIAGECSSGKLVLDETLTAMGCSPALFLHEQGNFDKGNFVLLF